MINQKYFHFQFLSIVFCFWFSIFIYIPVFGIYLDLNQIGYYATGIIMGSYGVMQFIIRFPIGILADKYKISGKLLVSIGFIVAIISSSLLSLFTNFFSIYMGRFLAGVTAAMWVVLTIWYSSYFEKSRSLRAMGQLQATTVASQLISMVISGWIANTLGYTSLFWVGGIFAMIGLVLVLLLQDQNESNRDDDNELEYSQKAIVKSTMKNLRLWSLSILSLFAHAVLFITMFGFSPVYLNLLNDHSSALLILVIAFMMPHTLAPVFLSLRKEPMRNPFSLLVVCFGIGALALLVMWNVTNWLIYCALHIVIGLTLGLIFPILLDQVYRIGTENSSKTTMGFFQSVYSIGIVVGPILAGYFSNLVQLEAVFMLSAAILLAGGLIATIEAINASRSEKNISVNVK